jgi:hypothetical protein
MNASGRDDTALANAILNGFAMTLSAAAAWYKKDLMSLTPADVESLKTVLQLSVCGDDTLGFLPPLPDRERAEFLTRLRANIGRFGFEAKAFASDKFSDGVYLGHRPLPVNGRYYWHKTLGRCLYKVGWQPDVVGDGAAYMHGIMRMHTLCSAHTPILADIATTYCSLRAGSKVTEAKLDNDRPWEWMGMSNPGHYADDTIAELAAVYSSERSQTRGDLEPHSVVVTSSDIRHCIEYVKANTLAVPCVLDHWVLKHMVWVDDL